MVACCEKFIFNDKHHDGYPLGSETYMIKNKKNLKTAPRKFIKTLI